MGECTLRPCAAPDAPGVAEDLPDDGQADAAELEGVLDDDGGLDHDRAELHQATITVDPSTARTIGTLRITWPFHVGLVHWNALAQQAERARVCSQ